MQKCLCEITNIIERVYTCNKRLKFYGVEIAFNFYDRRNPKKPGWVKHSKLKHLLAFDDGKHLAAYMRGKGYTALHVGPYYHYKSKQGEEKATDFIINPRPLVFDIDGSDYAEIRRCGCGTQKKICQQCWNDHVVPAVNRVYEILHQFGFSHILTVFSGRRGVHVYCTDQEVWYLSSEQRKMIVTRIMADGTTLLDRPVTEDMQHLIKALLFKHHATGNVCMPIDAETFDVVRDPIHYTKITKEQIRAAIVRVRDALLY